MHGDAGEDGRKEGGKKQSATKTTPNLIVHSTPSTPWKLCVRICFPSLQGKRQHQLRLSRQTHLHLQLQVNANSRHTHHTLLIAIQRRRRVSSHQIVWLFFSSLRFRDFSPPFTCLAFSFSGSGSTTGFNQQRSIIDSSSAIVNTLAPEVLIALWIQTRGAAQALCLIRETCLRKGKEPGPGMKETGGRET